MCLIVSAKRAHSCCCLTKTFYSGWRRFSSGHPSQRGNNFRRRQRRHRQQQRQRQCRSKNVTNSRNDDDDANDVHRRQRRDEPVLLRREGRRHGRRTLPGVVDDAAHFSRPAQERRVSRRRRDVSRNDKYSELVWRCGLTSVLYLRGKKDKKMSSHRIDFNSDRVDL